MIIERRPMMRIVNECMLSGCHEKICKTSKREFGDEFCSVFDIGWNKLHVLENKIKEV